MNYYVYIVECADRTYYCGYTKNLVSRIEEHNNAKVGAKYIKARRPVKLVYSEIVSSRSLALKREFEIKQLSRQEKEQLIQSLV